MGWSRAGQGFFLAFYRQFIDGPGPGLGQRDLSAGERAGTYRPRHYRAFSFFSQDTIGYRICMGREASDGHAELITGLSATQISILDNGVKHHGPGAREAEREIFYIFFLVLSRFRWSSVTTDHSYILYWRGFFNIALFYRDEWT